MAESSNTAHDSAEFKPFVWNPLRGLDHKERRYALFLNDARDVVQGAHTLMELLAWDEDRRDEARSSNGPAPLFSAADRSSLQRFASASLCMLHAKIEGQCDGLGMESDGTRHPLMPGGHSS
ncbi:hypothetical protein J2W30_005792 [Variovorax boronicumulans]|uniref:hypothetical protein n=1 Tax=Variovorax TaxID=34072 RepID=UPI00278A4353|nr:MULTISPECIES: hypothetical protein [Variovorax]MDQ0038006.1 hypothetical protein [Variovorax boronicumulans]MDQ0610081.1 hypothetical protein [Variovorax sp. W1I1]